MTKRKTHPRSVAAAMAGFSPSTGYRLEKDPRLPSQKMAERRHGGGKPDPFDGIWETDVLPMLESVPRLRPVTILHELSRRYPDRDILSARRTLERRVGAWKAVHGPQKEVIFRQEHPPGRQGMSDFCDGRSLGVTIQGQPLAHLLYHFTLVYSGWEHAEVVLGGESYTALATGLQNALWSLGGAPAEHRTDSLSAAFANLAKDADEDARGRYDALVKHCGMVATRNNRGIAHENGSIESRHGHLRDRIDQALLLRGSADFDSIDDYRALVGQVIARHNALRRRELAVEAPLLRDLPRHRTVDYDEERVVVTTMGGFTLRKVFYTVPSSFIGQRLRIRLHDDRLECYLGTSHVLTLPRGRAVNGVRQHIIDYRHVIHSLRRKPQALANLTYRDKLFPRDAYRATWEALAANLDQRTACKTMVGLLWLAHDRACEAELAGLLQQILDGGDLPDLTVLEQRFQPAEASVPHVTVRMPDAATYDALLPA